LPGVYLHYFHASDYDREIHNHPWENARSLILSAGYIETRAIHWYKNGDQRFPYLHDFVRLPGARNGLLGDTFHRVTLFKDDDGNEIGAWTLFVAGRKLGEPWGFYRDGSFKPETSSDKNQHTICQ
jgi:hypothetical protein